ncbi:phage tail protein [Sphingobium sp. MK2]|uniref:phage tail protein n=1 Tax=Sphingobium sp. MK2 TaxID=3116540 RepID=UPI0032E360B0
MATVVLTAVGTALGGPIGAAIGAVLGNVIDREILFKPKGREGPRLSDLQIQTSTYGAQIPRLFGTMRVAGTVIWATDLKEVRSKSGGGKGRSSVASYSYSASFAVALSARAIGSIGRIWADGNLLRGVAGDFKTELSAFRVHGGGEDQAVDPLIASAQGVAMTPAHRGMAYVLFEDLALADYGNRIPSLTFEVVAEAGPVSVGAIASDLSDGALGGEGLPEVAGFAASGGDVREAIATLAEVHGLALQSDAGGLRLTAAGSLASGHVDATMLARRVNGRAMDAIERSAAAAETVPVALSLRHYDGARDYQAGVQRVMRPGPGRVERGVELPAVLEAGAARALAGARLQAGWAGRATMTLRCDWSALGLAVGAVVSVDDAPGLWRIEEREWEGMAVRLALRRVPGAGPVMPGAASSGAIVRQVDAPHGATHLVLAELPPVREGLADGPLIVAAASGGAGWRSAALFVMSGTGEAVPIGPSAPRAVVGVAETALPVGSATLVDARHALTVALLADDMDVFPTDEAGLAQGRNLCLVGRELMQFAGVEALGAGRFVLRGLRRGLRGTEWAMAVHEAGEPFLLIEEDRLVEPLTALGGQGEIGAMVEMRAVGRGDAVPVAAALTIGGDAVMPPSPVHLAARATVDGWAFGWTRRSRNGWRWVSGGDVPLGEESERYAVTVLDGGAVVRAAESATPQWQYAAAMIATDGVASRALVLEVRQVGTLATGRAARVDFTA